MNWVAWIPPFFPFVHLLALLCLSSLLLHPSPSSSSSFPAGLFSPTALVIKLASSVGLLTLTATLIECLALYILPNKTNYREQIIDTSTVEMGRETAERKKKAEDPKAS